MTQNEVKELFNDEAKEVYSCIDIYLNQKNISNFVFYEKSKLSRIKTNKTASLDDLRKICYKLNRISEILKQDSSDLLKKIEEFETKGTFQTSIK